MSDGAARSSFFGSEPPGYTALDASLAERFGTEADLCAGLLSGAIVTLEAELPAAARWEEMMRVAHSLKGAARVVGLVDVAHLAHTLEDFFTVTRKQGALLSGEEVDSLLETVDLFQSAGQATAQREPRLMRLVEDAAREVREKLLATSKLVDFRPAEPSATAGEMHFFDTDNDNAPEVADHSTGSTEAVLILESSAPRPAGGAAAADRGAQPAGTGAQAAPKTSLALSRIPPNLPPKVPTRKSDPPATVIRVHTPAQPAAGPQQSERVLRVAAESIDRLMGLAGESLVESRRVAALSTSLARVKREHAALIQALAGLEHRDPRNALRELSTLARNTGKVLTDHQSDFDDYVRRVEQLGERLYREALKTRMRPFADGAQGLPRLVRDISRKLGKRVRLIVMGEQTEVDRDVLDALEAPLNHLLRNALDHGVEGPSDRVTAGKPELAQLRVEVRHRAGLLCVTVSDDGRGIDPDRIRAKAIDKGLIAADTAASLQRHELFDFLFLPGFSTASTVSEISGRGVGLDVVRTSLEGLGGTVRVDSQLGRGTSFELLLPVTRSVMRALVAEVDGEAFAFPLLRIERIDRVPHSSVRFLEGQRYTMLNDRVLSLVSARRVLGFSDRPTDQAQLNVVVISDHGQRIGVVVDEFRGEHDLVVRPLDSRLGRVEDISAAAVLTDGTTALIVDVDDMIRSVERLIRSGDLVDASATQEVLNTRKRVLVVDDSITVREAERQVLTHRGFDVDVAVDGYEGLHAARRTRYDLIITDIDMPRMNGVELVRNIRQDPALNAIPIVVVSYKNRPEDRDAGMAAGASAYLSKSSFHDERLLEVVDRLLETTR
jgi:two-component system, chemotaxis family, sensor histidine kinase and response regulator WspE